MNTYEFRYTDADAPDNERCLELTGVNLQLGIQGGMAVVKTPQNDIRASAPAESVLSFDAVDGGYNRADRCESEIRGRTIEWTDERHLSDNNNG